MKTKLLLLFAFSILLLNANTRAQTLQFKQLNFNYGGTISNNSDWGAVDLTFIGNSSILYFNLTVDTSWVIRNFVVMSLHDVGVPQTQRFWFPIGTDGVPVLGLIYGFTLTPAPAGKPLISNTSTVQQDTVRILSGDNNPPPGGVNKPAAAAKQIADPAVKPAQNHKNFPNQPSDVNACVPTGISNSLQFLNTKHALGMAAADISIDSLKKGTGYTAQGCPRPGWVKNKQNYVNQKKLPITTRKLDGPKNISKIGDEIAAGQDVEMDIKWKGPGAHCVSITGWVDKGNGKYQVTITHDKKQKGNAEDLVDETATYDSNTGTWDAALAIGTNDFFFVVECPPDSILQPDKKVPGGEEIKSKGSTGSVFSEGNFEVKNMKFFNYSNSTAPSLGLTDVISLSCDVELDLSVNSGASFEHYIATATITESITHTNDDGALEHFDVEMISLNLSGGGLPLGIQFRENPLLPSTGIIVFNTGLPDFPAFSFVNMNLEMSIDNGGFWFQESNGNTMLLQSANTQIVTPTVSLHLNILLEASYIGGGLMNTPLFNAGLSTNPLDADLITISAMQSFPPYNLVESQTDTLKKNGDVDINFSNLLIPNVSYYIKVNHRNHIETWSKTPVFLSVISTYIFSDAASKASGDNQAPTRTSPGQPGDGFGFALYGGDIWDGFTPGGGQDGSIDATDFLFLDPFIQSGDGGYIPADLNGDGAVDATDFIYMDPNIQNGVGAVGP